MKMKHSNLVLMFLAVALTAGGFLLFQELLSGKASSYTTEIAAAVLGSLLTIVITAIMLNKQTEVDMAKDRNAKMLEYRWEVYTNLNDFLQEILSSEEHVQKEAVVQMQILNQQIAYVGSQEVVEKFSDFVKRFSEIGSGRKISNDEMDDLMHKAGALSIAIRSDLMSESERREFGRSEDKLRKCVTDNVSRLKRKDTDRAGFLAECTDPDDRNYYDRFLSIMDEEGIEPYWQTKGFSIGGMMQCYPSSSNRRNTIMSGKLDADQREQLEALLKGKSYVDKISFAKTRVSFNVTDVPLEDLQEIMDLFLFDMIKKD